MAARSRRRRTFHATRTYDGSIAAGGEVRSGSFDFVFVGAIDAQGHAHGRLVIQSGSGGLVGLHGFLDLAGISGVGGTYAGQPSGV